MSYKKHTYAFEKLEVWHDAKEVAISAYKVTEDFPDKEQYVLVSQIRRAAISIPSNIAEGSSRSTRKEQARFYSSAIELLNQLIISKELGYLSDGNLKQLREQIEKTSNRINALKKSIE